MKCRFVLLVLMMSIISAFASAQPDRNQSQPNYGQSDPLANMSNDVSRIARSVESLNRAWADFARTFSTNQGLQLDERQRSLILALEVLNRVEVSLANMQKLRLDLIERQSRFRIQLATVIDDLLPQSIDRYVALRGTTDAEGLREIRRQSLIREQRELSTVLGQIERELIQTNEEIRRTEQQVRSIRGRVFGEVERQMSEFQ